MSCMCEGYPGMTARGSPHRKGSLRCLYAADGALRHVDMAEVEDFAFDTERLMEDYD